MIGAAALLTSLSVAASFRSAAPRILLPPLVVLGTALLLFRRSKADASHRTRQADADAEAAATRIAELEQAAAEMRHDLRGILSPALLTADRLVMSQDALARRAGEAMITTVERAEARLRRG